MSTSTTGTIGTTKALTEEEIKNFAVAWFYALDIHAPVEECYRLLADEGLNMQFPDGDIRDFATFKKWYDRVTNLFFDEIHNLHTAKAAINGTEAEVEVVVGWQASWFPAPAAKSKRTAMNAVQRWKVRRSGKNGYGVEIVEYMVDRFDYAPGFARL
jgi:hypothetical protein